MTDTQPTKKAKRSVLQRALGLNARGRKLTPEELAELRSEKAERDRLEKMKTMLFAEGEDYASAIPTALEQMGVCYRFKKSETDSRERVSRVRFQRPHICNEQSIFLKIDTQPGRLPRGVGIEHLGDEDVLRNLAVAVKHPVRFAYTPERGAWYIVDREAGVGGIPKHIDYATMIASRPASASGLTLPLGVGLGKKFIWKDLGQMPHMLVGGTTGQGKSNFLNEVLCTLLRFNSPQRLRLLLIDLKGGVEFTAYKNVPHVWKAKADDGTELQAIVEDREQVLPWLDRLLHEGERRLTALRDAGEKNIGQHNSKNPMRAWSHIVVVADEWSDIRLDPKLRGPAEETILSVASRFRAVGIHLILCTQVPSKEVVPLRLRTVLPARLAFACPNQTGSMSIIGSGRAVGLGLGRAILDWGREFIELQAPLINEATIAETVKQAIAGKFEEIKPEEHDVTPDAIFEWAVNDNGGDLDYRSLYARFKERKMTQAWAQSFCEQAEGQIVVVGSTTYQVMGRAGNRPRRLLPVSLPPQAEDTPENGGG
jgi:hypothetical protein